MLTIAAVVGLAAAANASAASAASVKGKGVSSIDTTFSLSVRSAGSVLSGGGGLEPKASGTEYYGYTTCINVVGSRAFFEIRTGDNEYRTFVAVDKASGDLLRGYKVTSTPQACLSPTSTAINNYLPNSDTSRKIKSGDIKITA